MQAAALACLNAPFEPDFHDTLVDNMLMWIERAKPTLAIAVIERLPGLAPNRAVRSLLQVLDSPGRDPVIRIAAFRILCTLPDATVLADALTDDDALIRAEAVAQMPVETAQDFIGDPAQPVRQIAVRRIASDGADTHVQAAADRAILVERADTLSDLIAAAPVRRAERRRVAGLYRRSGDANSTRPRRIDRLGKIDRDIPRVTGTFLTNLDPRGIAL